MRIFHTIASKIVFPTAQGRMYVRLMDSVFIYYLMEHIPVNHPAMVLGHMICCVEKAKHALPYGGWLTLVFNHWKIPMVGDYGTMSHLTNQIIGQKGMSYAGGILKMKDDVKGNAAGTGTNIESVQATYALVKQLSDQNTMMQSIINSVTQLCSALQESYRRVEVRLDQAGIPGHEDSAEKEESSHAAEEDEDLVSENEEEEEVEEEDDASEDLEEEDDDGETGNDSRAD